MEIGDIIYCKKDYSCDSRCEFECKKGDKVTIINFSSIMCKISIRVEMGYNVYRQMTTFLYHKMPLHRVYTQYDYGCLDDYFIPMEKIDRIRNIAKTFIDGTNR